MNVRFREALREAYQANSAVYTDFQQYDTYMEKFAAEDMLSYSLPRTCLLIPDEMDKLRAACSENDVAKAIEICQELERILRNEHGIRPYHAAWSINCWMYAISAHICYFNSEYAKMVEAMPSDKLIPLANSGDAYASATMYSRDMSQKDWLAKTEQYDHPVAIYYRSVELRGDLTNPEKNQQALELCLKAMDMGYSGVSPELALLYQGAEGIEKNAVEAFKYALMGADLGIHACIHMVSEAYLNGDGVEANPQLSFAYLEKLAEAGDAKAQCMCGCAYHDGVRGAVVDHEKSYYWLRKSADQGDSIGQLLTGKALMNGIGVSVNGSEALYYFKACAEQGNVEAMEQIAGMYFRGEEIPKNEEEAAAWYRKAAEAGSGFACSLLADFYEYGIGVPKNRARADQYRRKADELGYHDEDDDAAEEKEVDIDNVDLNDPSFQANARAFAAEALEMMGYEDDDAETEYIDDDWNFKNIGNGDGITEIRDQDLKELFRVMKDTWNAFASVTEKHGLDIYKDQGRYYMYMLSKMAIEFCNKRIENFAYYLLNFLYSSSCRHYMGDSAEDNFNTEFTACSETFDNIHREGHDLGETMMIYLYSVNLHQGHYRDDVAREVSIEQIKYTEQFLSTLASIAEKR